MGETKDLIAFHSSVDKEADKLAILGYDKSEKEVNHRIVHIRGLRFKICHFFPPRYL